MKEIIKLSLILGFVCVLAGASLSFVYEGTKERIKQNKKDRLNESLEKVLHVSKEEVKEEVKEVKSGNLFERLKKKLELKSLYKREKPDGTVVYAASVSIGGYQGTIKMLVGFAPKESVVLGVKILEHSETPGLGARVAKEEADQKTFTDRLKGKLKDQNEYDTITGATISSKAVIGGVVSVLECGLKK